MSFSINLLEHIGRHFIENDRIPSLCGSHTHLPDITLAHNE